MTFYIPEDIVNISEKVTGLKEVGASIWVLDDVLSPEQCQFALNVYERNKQSHYDGVTGAGVNKNIKDSIDMPVRPMSEDQAIVDQMFYEALHAGSHAVIRELMNFPVSLPFFDPNNLFAYDTGYQIQKTTPGGKYVWHVENAQIPDANIFRSLTYVLYLNDVPVENGGATGFLYQKCSVQPRAGRLVIFAPFWTHVHCGMPLLAGEKYIMTGWFFANSEK